MTVSFLIPTTGRRSLERTVRSIEPWIGDEILIVGEQTYMEGPFIRSIHCPRGNDWGHTERNFAQQHARCDYIAHIDDDDWYAPGTRALMQDAMRYALARPILFRMRFPNGITLWREQKIYCGNVGTPMFLIPNRPEMFGKWGSFVGGDCQFLETSKWDLTTGYIWRPEVIAMLDHDPGAPPSAYVRNEVVHV